MKNHRSQRSTLLHRLSSTKPRLADFLWLVVITFSFVIVLPAQEYRGLILGQVTDPSGAAITGAAITATGPQQQYSTQTDAGGSFTIPFVQPGTYEVTVEAPGFKKAARTGVVIDISQKVNVNFKLELGVVSEVVSVEAEAVGVNTADASGGTVIGTQLTQELPVNGRSVYDLLALTPGVRGSTTSRGWDQRNDYVINGVQNNYNQFTLNGAPISQQTSSGRGTWLISPNTDGVAEFKVMTNTYDAQYGRVGGGTVNVVMKSGTNRFHGTAYDYWRNRVLDANTFANNQRGGQDALKVLPAGIRCTSCKPQHNQHDFGGTVGGPIKPEKLFFFFSYEGWRESAPTSGSTNTVSPDLRPITAAQAAASGGTLDPGDVDFRQFFTNTLGSRYNSTAPTTLATKGGIFNPFVCATSSGGNCVTRQRIVNAHGVQDVIPARLISPIGLKILNLYPAANSPGEPGQNNYVFNAPGSLNFNQPIIRVDYNLSDRTKIYGMFSHWAGTQFQNNTGYVDPASLPLIQGNINSTRSFLSQILSGTHTFRDNLLADIRVSYARGVDSSPNGAVAAGLVKLTPADLGFANYPVPPTTNASAAPTIRVSNLPDIIGNRTFSDFGHPPFNQIFEVAPTVSHVIGRHNLKYGGQFMLIDAIPCCGNGDSEGLGVGPGGRFSFNSNFSKQGPNINNNNDGAGLASLLLGVPSGDNPTDNAIPYSLPVYEAYKYYAVFIQNDLKLRRNLTVNLGLRWDIETSPRERHNRLNAGFNYGIANPITDFVINPGTITMPAGGTFTVPNPIVGGFAFASDKLAPYDTHWNQWQPKFGIAWGISPKTVLRGGYGLGYVFAIELGGSTTFSRTTRYQASNGTDPNPANLFNSGIPYPNGLVTPPGSTFGLLSGVGGGSSFDQRNRRIPHVHSYSLGIQRELPGKMILDVSFVGTYSKEIRVGVQFGTITPSQFQYCHDHSTDCTTSIPNPFYWRNLRNQGASLPPDFLASYKASDVGGLPTIRRVDLMSAFPEFGGNVFSNTEPIGYTNYNSLVTKLEKRISGGNVLINGLTFLGSFTWSKTMQATGFLNNGFLHDPNLLYRLTDSDRTFDFAFAGLYGLPFGKNGILGKDSHGALGELINDWSVDWILTMDSGTPVNGIPNTLAFNCPQNNNSYLPAPGKRNFSEWLYNETPSCFTNFDPFTAVTVNPRAGNVRNRWIPPQLTLAAQKKFRLREGLALQFRAEAFNATNTPTFGGPNTGGATNPTQPVFVNLPSSTGYNVRTQVPFGTPGSCTGYGCINANQANDQRKFQLSLKFLF